LGAQTLKRQHLLNQPLGAKMQNKTVLTTTLELLKEHNACESGYRKLKKTLGPKWGSDQPINLLDILDSNGVQDMMWCFRATEQDCIKQRYLICADMAESVLHLFTAKYPNDKSPERAIKAARDAANGVITSAAAASAAAAAYAAAAAAASYNAAAAASYNAAVAAAVAAAAASYNAAVAAARKKEREKQAAIIRKYLK
tara:strand:- start:36460 stop:37056 length:597 start_codon:yes stop_codon:yes gene_type:complete